MGSARGQGAIKARGGGGCMHGHFFHVVGGRLPEAKSVCRLVPLGVYNALRVWRLGWKSANYLGVTFLL